MPHPLEDEAWALFKGYMDAARPALDGSVPVALLCLPVEQIDADGAIQVKRHVGARIIWPKTFPIADRGPLLARVARQYRDDEVTR